MTHALPWSEILKHMTAIGLMTQERKLDPKERRAPVRAFRVVEHVGTDAVRQLAAASTNSTG